jgi:hypothetical protein
VSHFISKRLLLGIKESPPSEDYGKLFMCPLSSCCVQNDVRFSSETCRILEDVAEHCWYNRESDYWCQLQEVVYLPS